MKNNKKVIVMLVLVISVLLSAQCNATGEAKIIADKLSAVPGQTVEYRVSISGNPGLASFRIILKYDTSVLSLASQDESTDPYCERGNFAEGGTIICAPRSDGCQVFWADSNNATKDGTLFTIKFSVKSDAPLGDYPIRVSYVESDTIDSQEKTVPIICADGNVTVREYSPTISAQTLSAKQGEEFSYTISLLDNPGIASIKISIQFDNAVLSLEKDETTGSYIEAVGSSFSDGSMTCKAYSNGIVAFWYADDNNNADGELFTLRFKVNENAKLGNSPLEVGYDEESTLDAAEQKVKFQSNAGAVKIEDGAIVNISTDTNSIHAITISVANSSAVYAIVSYYNEAGRMVAVDITPLTNGKCDVYGQNDGIDYTKIVCKVILLDTNWCAVGPCYCKYPM